MEKCIFIRLLASLILCLYIYSTPLLAASEQVSFKFAQSFIAELQASKKDYLRNKDTIEKIYTTSQSSDWGVLSLNAAIAYCDYLFRSEQYELLKLHLDKLITAPLLEQYDAAYLLANELQIKSLLTSHHTDEADKLVSKLKSRLDTLNSANKIIVYRTLAYFYTDTDRITNTLVVANSGLELAELTEDDAAQGFFLRKISDSHNYLGEEKKANSYALQSMYAYQKTADFFALSKAYWSVGNSFSQLGKLDNAKQYFEKALVYFKEQKLYKGIVFAQYSLSNILASIGEREKALSVLEDNVVWAKMAGISDMELASMILIEDIYQKQEKWESADKINDQVYAKISLFSRSAYKFDFLDRRHILKKRLGKLEQALEASEEELKYYTLYMEEVTQDKVRSLQVKLDVKEKEQKITELARENSIIELRDKELQQNKIIWQLSALVSALIFVIVCVLLFWMWRQKKLYRAFALIDDLTKAPNRRRIIYLAQKAMRDNKPLTIAIADLDNFKTINDSFGHDIGDEVLVAFAKAATQSIRDIDFFGRYGGEEWLFVFHTNNEATVTEIFTRIRAKLNELVQAINLDHHPQDLLVTYSMGAITNKYELNNVDTLIKGADNLLYNAKNSGRDQLVFQS